MALSKLWSKSMARASPQMTVCSKPVAAREFVQPSIRAGSDSTAVMLDVGTDVAVYTLSTPVPAPRSRSESGAELDVKSEAARFAISGGVKYC